MNTIERIALLGSAALLCAACSGSPKPDATAQQAAMPAAAATATRAPAPATAAAATPDAATRADAALEANSSHAALMAQARISEDVARRTALGKVPNGTVGSAELENEHDRLVWSFDIAQPGSKDITEIQVDAKTGEIVSTEHETPVDQAKEAAADAQQKP